MARPQESLQRNELFSSIQLTESQTLLPNWTCGVSIPSESSNYNYSLWAIKFKLYQCPQLGTLTSPILAQSERPKIKPTSHASQNIFSTAHRSSTTLLNCTPSPYSPTPLCYSYVGPALPSSQNNFPWTECRHVVKSSTSVHIQYRAKHTVEPQELRLPQHFPHTSTATFLIECNHSLLRLSAASLGCAVHAHVP